MHPPIEHPVIPEVREPRPGGHEDLVPRPGRIPTRLEGAAQGDVRIREQPAADLVSVQRRLLPLRVHHRIQVAVYPVDVAPPLVIVHQIGHRGPLPHHLRDILQGEAPQLPHALIILGAGRPLLPSGVWPGYREPLPLATASRSGRLWHFPLHLRRIALFPGKAAKSSRQSLQAAYGICRKYRLVRLTGM